jgi:hypothetical protein
MNSEQTLDDHAVELLLADWCEASGTYFTDTYRPSAKTRQMVSNPIQRDDLMQLIRAASRSALAQPAAPAEPASWRARTNANERWISGLDDGEAAYLREQGWEVQPLYTSPPPSPVVREALPDSEARAMFVARLEHMSLNGDTWLTIPAVLALLNDCDMLAARAAIPATPAAPGYRWIQATMEEWDAVQELRVTHPPEQPTPSTAERDL